MPHGICELCLTPSRRCSKHHLIPRACHGNKWFKKNFARLDMTTRLIDLCRLCHHAVHDAVPSEKELGRKYNTRELLLGHEKIAIHVKWMRRRSKEGRPA